MIETYTCSINKLNKHLRRSKLKLRLSLGLLFLSLLFLGFMVSFDFLRFFMGLPSMMNLVQRLLSPNLAYGIHVLPVIFETIKIALMGSVIGSSLAIPYALLTAQNITPFRWLAKLLNAFFAFMRTIPSLVWAALLVSVFSVGVLPGVIALSITSFLMSLKLFREAIETIHPNTINATRSVGANSLQMMRFSVLPTISETYTAVFFLTLETNIRAATVLGLVGAGGIGQLLWRDLNHLKYDHVATILLFLFMTIICVDFISFGIRNHMKNAQISYRSVKALKKRPFVIAMQALILVIFILISAIQIWTVDFSRMSVGLNQAQHMVSRMMHIDLSYLPNMISGLKESLWIALFATLTGAISAVFFSYFASYFTSPNKYYAYVTKIFVSILRTFPPIIMAIIFFRGVGPGPLAGALALSLYTTGILTKLYSEAIEQLPENTQNSLISTGTTKIGAYRHGILPETLPTFIGLVLYRLESNIRTSTILGIIGAGGIGTMLNQNISWRNWERVGLLILGIACMIISIDFISGEIRKKLSSN